MKVNRVIPKKINSVQNMNKNINFIKLNSKKLALENVLRFKKLKINFIQRVDATAQFAEE